MKSFLLLSLLPSLVLAQGLTVKDGVASNLATVKAASTAAVTADTSLVCQLNPIQPNLTTPLNVSMAANASVNLAQVDGATTATGNGTAAGSLRVSMASDSTGTSICTQATGTNLHAVLDTTSTTQCTQATGTNLHVVTDATSVLAANQSVNVAQMNAVAVLMGTGATGTGSQRVTLATNSPGFSTANGTIAADSALQAARAVAYGSSPTAVTAGNQAPAISDLEGRLYSNTSHPRSINCELTTTATTSTQVTGCELVASNSIYVTSITICGDIASATASPAIIQRGTSTGCTGPVVIFSGYHPALSCINQTFPNPIKTAAGEGLCVLDAVVGTKKVTITGYVAP